MAVSYSFHEPTAEHIAELDQKMRAADRDEIVASHGPDTLRTLANAVRSSTHCLAVLDQHDDLACLMGVSPLSMVGGVGSPWMLGTHVLDDYPRTLARVARRYFGEVARVYELLENFVDVRNTASVKLLKWLGCSFDEPKPYGALGLPFMRFERRSG